MLNIIKGAGGTGKTTYIINLLTEMVKKGQEKILFIVPDQSTFETEKTFLKILGPMDSLKITVLGFSRLCEYVFSHNGSSGKLPLDEGGKAILMSLAIDECVDNIPLFSKTKNKNELISLMLSVVKEYKTCNLTSDKITETAETIPDATLKEKLMETILIKDTFEGLVNESYVDPDEYISIAYNSLLENNIFKDYIVALDAFSGFTNSELVFLEKLMVDSSEFYISLNTDNENNNQLFFTTERTTRQLKKIARDNGIAIASPVVLTEPLRYKNKFLLPIWDNIYRVEKESFNQTPENITLYNSVNKYTECDFVARNISQLVIENGYNYDDIAVVFRDDKTYEGIIDTVFEKYQIPYFMDKTEDIFTKPLIKLVSGIFDAVNSSFRRENILNILKSGLLSCTQKEISDFENYLFMWNINGSSFLSPFTENPRGFEPEFTSKDKDALELVNRIRNMVITPLMNFRESSKDKSATDITKGLYNLLIYYNIGENLIALCDKLIASGEHNLADEQRRLWDILMRVLDKMIALLGERPTTLKEYSDLIRLQFNNGDIGYIPKAMDQVVVSGIERVRLPQKKAVFVLGCNEGEFPINPTAGGVFTDAERRLLIESGLEVNDAVDELNYKEMYLAYYAVTLPSERLFVSYQSGSLKGEMKSPSSIVSELLEIYPNLKEKSDFQINTNDKLWCKNSAFQHLAKTFGSSTITENSLKEYFLQDDDYKEKVLSLENAVNDTPAKITSSDRATELFGENIRLSASQVESFYMCKFQYFCRYGLRIKERKPAVIDNLQYGTLMHYIFERFFREHNKEEYCTFSKEQVEKIVASYLDDYAENELGGMSTKPKRFVYLFLRMKDNAIEIVYHIIQELSQSDFVPIAFEMNVGEDLPCYELSVDENTKLMLTGSIDRVDLMEKNGSSYIRVIDYKTGHKDFKLSDILYGINLQMLIYLSAIKKNGSQRFNGEIVPCGVLYQPSTNKYINADNDEDFEKIQSEQNKNLKMKGLILDNPTVVSAMDKMGTATYIPVTYSGGKLKSTDSIASLQELGKLFNKIDSLLIEMAEELHKGEIEYNPVKSASRYDACTWCPYLSVCGYEQGKNCRRISSLSKKEVFDELRKEEEDA